MKSQPVLREYSSFSFLIWRRLGSAAVKPLGAELNDILVRTRPAPPSCIFGE